jgi:hypothetical protein
MTRLPRAAALQVGEFAVGVVVAYAGVAATFALTGSLWPVLLVAAGLISAGISAEVRWGPRATGLLAGLAPTAFLAAVVFTAFWSFLYRLD